MKLFIITWRGIDRAWQSERYAANATAARSQFKRDRASLAHKLKAQILCTKEHDGRAYLNRGRFV